jgi:hypothetical protein
LDKGTATETAEDRTPLGMLNDAAAGVHYFTITEGIPLIEPSDLSKIVDEGTLKNLFYGLLAALPRRRRFQLAILLGLTLLSSITEVASLGAVIPLIAVLASPDVVLQKPVMREVINFLGLGAHDNLRWNVTVLFMAAALAANSVRLFAPLCFSAFDLFHRARIGKGNISAYAISAL